MRRLATLLVVAAALSACTVVRTEVEPREQAIDHLNHGRYEQAVAMLEQMHRDDPDDKELNILLASAYAGSVGMNVVDAFDVFAPALFTNQKLSLQGDEPKSDKEKAEDDPLKKLLIKYLEEFLRTFKTVSAVPHVETAKRGRLVEALRLLKDVPETDALYVRSRSYSAVLNLFQFLNYGRDTAKEAFDLPTPGLYDVACSLDPALFVGSLGTASGYLEAAATDVRVPYEKAGKPLPDAMKKLEAGAAGLKAALLRDDLSLEAAESALTAVKAEFCR